MISYLKKHLVKNWIEERIIDEGDKELYEYGIEITIEYFFNIITTIVLALITKEVISCIFMYVSFMMLRSYSGGIHARTFFRCYIYSSLVLFVTLILIKYGMINIWIYRVAAFVSILYLWRTKPVESENKEVNERERAVFRKKEKIIISIIAAISIVAIFIGFVKIEKGLESTLVIAGISSAVCIFIRVFASDGNRNGDGNTIILRKSFDTGNLEQGEDEQCNSDYLEVKLENGVKCIKLDDIMYVHCEKKKMYIYLKDGEEYIVCAKLDFILKELKEYNEFIRIQKSYLVNFDYVKRYEIQRILLWNGQVFSISKNKVEKVRERYLKLKI